MHELISLVIVLLVFAGLQLVFLVMLLHRSYRIVPSGCVGVRSGAGGLRPVSFVGILVVPGLHKLYTVHAEVEALHGNGGEIVVQLNIERDHILRAFEAFGQKRGSELRQQLQKIVDSTEGDESVVNMKLAEVGYRII